MSSFSSSHKVFVSTFRRIQTQSRARPKSMIGCYEAVQSIKRLNVKHQNDKDFKKKTMQSLWSIYELIGESKDCHVLNEFMRICFDYSQPHKVQKIWKDIELFEENNKSKDFLQYSLLMKCLIKSNLGKEEMSDKCVQVLTWIKEKKYTLSIHIGLLQKLIVNCGKCKSVKALRLIELLLKLQLIDAQNEDEKIKCALITAYGQCNDVETALTHFYAIKQRHGPMIASMMNVFVEGNLSEEALRIYDENISSVDNECHLQAMRACVAKNDKERGKEIISRNQLNECKNKIMKLALLDFYELFCDLDGVKRIFSSIHRKDRDGFIHNKLMRAYFNEQCYEEALAVFESMSDALKDDVSHLIAMRACTKLEAFEAGNKIFEKVRNEKIGIQLKTAMIDFFNKYEHVTNAQNIFESVPSDERDGRLFNAMLRAFVDNDFSEEGIEFYEENNNLCNGQSFMLLLTACIQMNNYEKGIVLKKELMSNGKLDIYLTNRLIDFHGHFNETDVALQLFESEKASNNEHSLASMMKAFIRNEEFEKAIKVYFEHDELHDDINHILAIKACRNMKDFEKGKDIHQKVRLDEDTKIELFNSLIGLYADCRDIDGAIAVFDGIAFDKRDIATIHCLMECYYHCSMDNEVINLYKSLNSNYPKLRADVLIYITLLKSLTNLSMLSYGQEIERKLIENRMANHAEIKMNLINLFGKCGQVEKCEGIFNRDHFHHIGIWNAMLRAYGRNGDMLNANNLFQAMKQRKNPTPDCKTYAIMMNACNHCGDFEMAQCILANEMNKDDMITYLDDKFVVCAFTDCMARSGNLKETYSYLVEHNICFEEAWRALLSACRKYEDSPLANKVLYQLKYKLIR